MNKDGIAFKSSWISKEDGLLVLDKNSNNLIDNGNELFGNFTKIDIVNKRSKDIQINLNMIKNDTNLKNSYKI